MTDIQNVNEELQKEPLTESTNVAEPAEETNGRRVIDAIPTSDGDIRISVFSNSTWCCPR